MNVLRGALLTAAVAAATLASGSPALAGSVKTGTKVLCVLASGVNSAQLKTGADFKLRVDDPGHPELAGATVHGHVTDVEQPSGLNRARIGFVLDYVHFKNGTKEPIQAAVLSQSVVQTNTAFARQEQAKLSLPMMPVGTVTPGPVAWQMNIGGGSKPSVALPLAGGTSGGYVYAQKANEAIILLPGSPVTIQLAATLTTP